MTLINSLPLGTVVRYEGDEGERYTICAYDESSNTHRYAKRCHGDEAMFAKSADGVAEYFLPAEFADGSVEVVTQPYEPTPVEATSWNEALLALAIAYEREVHFRYVKASGDIAERRVEPDVIHTARDGSRFVTGYDPDRGDVRAYRLDRIRGDVQA